MKLRFCCAVLLFGSSMALISTSSARERSLWDGDWRFHLGDSAGAQAPNFETAGWQQVQLPHDWSIGLSLDKSAPAEGHGGFFQNGIGWYRKTFRAPESWRGQVVTLEFEGVYANAEVFVNGVAVGSHGYGFTPFTVELTPHLRLGADNVVAVRVDHSAQPTARFYTGSGIYRHVWLRVTSPVRVAHDGVCVTTRALTAGESRGGSAASAAEAELDVAVTVANATAETRHVTVEIEILDTAGKRVARTETAASVSPNGESRVARVAKVLHPQLWSPGSPVLYRAVVRAAEGRKVIDEHAVTFGIRTLHWSAEHGLELNGASIKLNGGNVHHDTGILGAAAFDRAEERKVELLKAAGFNAVRTAHNPPSRAFLEACDRLGVLVMDEIFDGWAKGKTKHDYHVNFAREWESDVDAWIKRDRNHPSVIIWSIGNEMYERTTAKGQRLARELAARVRLLDRSRPVSAGVNGAGQNGGWEQLDPLFASLDLAGYNYELAAQHTNDHARLPGRIMMATESYQSEVFANWAIVQAQPYVVGDFVWSALDYLGESGIGRVFPPDEPAVKHWEGNMWPWHGAACGDIDLTGWRKPVSHYRNIVWDRGEKLFAAVLQPSPDGRPWNLTPWSMPPSLPSWTWPGAVGTPLTVEVYSRYESVRLSLNGRVTGEQSTTQAGQFPTTFVVPYAPGELRVDGVSGGRVAETFTLKTAEAPAALRLTADRVKLRANGEDLAFITVEAVDRDGRWNPTATARVEFSVEGTGVLAGVGSADLTAMDSYAGSSCALFQGRALVAVRTKGKAGKIVLHARTAGLPDAQCVLRATQP